MYKKDRRHDGTSSRSTKIRDTVNPIFKKINQYQTDQKG